ncbi:hypothetical protein PIROE2DRAFT_6723, partial [Piromyces sp. E2]
VKPKEVENEGISWDFDLDDEDEKTNNSMVVKFASSSSTNSINNIPPNSSTNSLHASSSCSITADAPPLTPIKEDIASIKNNELSINNNTNTNTNTNTNSLLNNTIKNYQSTLSSETNNDSSTQSPPKYYMQKNSSSELGFHSLPRSKGRFIIDTGDSMHCESPASINNNSITSLNRGNSMSNNLINNGSIENTTSIKFPNGTKAMLGRHLSLADKNGSYSNDNLIIEKRSRFEVSHPSSSTSAIEPKPSRFIVTEGNGNTFTEGRRSRVLEVTSEPPSRHSSNGSISSSNNSINSNSYSNLVNSENADAMKGINKKIELLIQNSEHQNKLLELLQNNISQNKLLVSNSIYNTSDESNQVLTAAGSLMDKLNEVLKELDYLKMENKVLKQNIEKANKINGQLNQKLISLEQENALLLQKKNEQSQ